MFRFAEVDCLWLLLVVPLLLAALIYSRWAQRRRYRRFASQEMRDLLMPYASRARYWVRAFFFLLGVCFLVFALARPQYGLKEVKAKREGVEVMMVLDVSKSMDAQDVKPSRLLRAKLEITKLLEQMQQDRIGLILFAGTPYVQLPITNDFVSARMFLQSVNTDMVSMQGTALGAAISLGMRSFSPDPNVGKAMIVISDGENHEDDPVAAAREAFAEGIRIYTVGIGSPEGAPIPEAGGGPKKDAERRVVISRLDEEALMKVAAEGGGIYMRATNQYAGLTPILTEMDKLQKAEFEDVAFTGYNEQYQTPLLLAILCFVIGSLILERRNPWFSVDLLYKTLGR